MEHFWTVSFMLILLRAPLQGGERDSHCPVRDRVSIWGCSGSEIGHCLANGWPLNRDEGSQDQARRGLADNISIM